MVISNPDALHIYCQAKHLYEERVYDEFWTQTPIDMARFSSLSMEYPPQHEIYHDFFPARHIAQYLSEYVDKQTYVGRSIRQRIIVNSKVVKVDLSAGSGRWQIHCQGSTRPFLSRTLLVAPGLTSQANMPELPGRPAFRGVVIHHVDFGNSSIMKDPQMNHIAVLGGAKSAADIAYAAAKAGKKVSWIIRASGSGPAHLTPAQGIGPYKNSNELLYTRLTACFNPSIWNPRNWLSRLLHGTRIGRRAVESIWKTFDSNSRREAGYRGQRVPDGVENGFANLEPDTS
jgi:dimethylaniline monooxygenase (N-oxide forming)